MQPPLKNYILSNYNLSDLKEDFTKKMPNLSYFEAHVEAFVILQSNSNVCSSKQKLSSCIHSRGSSERPSRYPGRGVDQYREKPHHKIWFCCFIVPWSSVVPDLSCAFMGIKTEGFLCLLQKNFTTCFSKSFLVRFYFLFQCI